MQSMEEGFQALLKLCRRSLLLIGMAETILASLILIGIVAMIVAQVLLNAGLGKPITWEQEAGAYALVWLTFLGASVALKQMRHVTITSFVGRLHPRLRALVRTVVFAIIIWTLCILIKELFPIMTIESRSTTIALPIDLPRSYFFSVPLLITSAMMMLTTILYLLEAVLGVLGTHDLDTRAVIE
jgi:TRAP-type C4-dicarboxylate transport system permease small subunit